MTKGAGPGYEGLQRKKLLTLLITLALVLTAALVEAGTGSIKFGLDDIFLALTGRGSATANTVLFGIRFPRAVAAILVGAALAMSGAVMQCVLHNPLASASTLGVSQGAAFGAAVGIIVVRRRRREHRRGGFCHQDRRPVYRDALRLCVRLALHRGGHRHIQAQARHRPRRAGARWRGAQLALHRRQHSAAILCR
ncbi:MAG: iron chelate uptake ABC transporter family permease subunit [Lachnospiraceae bacterium]